MKTEPVRIAKEAAVVINLEAPDVSPRREQLRQDIAKRVRKACGHLSDAEFAELVEKMVQAQLKGERRFGFHHPTAQKDDALFS